MKRRHFPTGDLRLAHKYLKPLVDYHLYQHMINETGTVGAGLVVDNNCSESSCLSCLIDTSGGAKHAALEPLNTKNHYFTERGSGQP